MKIILTVPLLLLAALFAASGVAAITRSWVLPRNRRHVRNFRVYGGGQLMVAFALACQAVFGLLIDDIDLRQVGTLTGSVLLVAGLFVMMAGQLRGRQREGRIPGA
ncbi:hypothetical protein JCM4814A_72640 [Streptomyces phaeofaciens JCM 4814]|uniref:Uncharacterized protein n=1 Tax=Streptomyces phaeofaciens TaxID=68254 RepID=A0A918LX32_9ACTN|nr:hypothetical protein [Streptomyces phaeofaciens]GGT62325.1 hypothetical protein GCM10010226_45100 [Streptomyces phaeofaciens]